MFLDLFLRLLCSYFRNACLLRLPTELLLIILDFFMLIWHELDTSLWLKFTVKSNKVSNFEQLPICSFAY